ncbi:toxin-activating lysine-acyltransferase [Salinispirillum sp. LH 10-3-1]|uniref:RTX toxin-activating lysine-acyltransferase n=1 Tax=Salinispirillum sp. LH 10-3-1 TaxID=2952525 RepID=A0AB38YFN0_9GAMM
MNTDINSPLAPVPVPQNGQLNLFVALGIVTDLCINHGDYHQLSIEKLIARVLPALQAGQVHIVFDPQSRPLGFASWVLADDNLHAQLTQTPSLAVINNASSVNNMDASNQENQYLWFVDLITPFSSPLPMFHSLKERFAGFSDAWALAGNNTEAADQPRRIW